MIMILYLAFALAFFILSAKDKRLNKFNPIVAIFFLIALYFTTHP